MAITGFLSLYNDGIADFEHGTQMANLWLDDLMECLGWEDRYQAYQSLRFTLRALRDHLLLEQAIQLGTQLPLLLRGVYYEDWSLPPPPSGNPRTTEAFLASIRRHLEAYPSIDSEAVTCASLEVIADCITADSIQAMVNTIAQELKSSRRGASRMF